MNTRDIRCESVSRPERPDLGGYAARHGGERRGHRAVITPAPGTCGPGLRTGPQPHQPAHKLPNASWVRRRVSTARARPHGRGGGSGRSGARASAPAGRASRSAASFAPILQMAPRTITQRGSRAGDARRMKQAFWSLVIGAVGYTLMLLTTWRAVSAQFCRGDRRRVRDGLRNSQRPPRRARVEEGAAPFLSVSAMRRVGLEPTRPFSQRCLRPSRLPVSTPPQAVRL